ncbi:MAG: FAD binding domain-containing protein [Xanthobacteraceae bacterium]
MKPAPFEYARPSDVDEACALLAADDGARVIAGGQTLVPLMAMRLARPTRLVDIGRLAELSFVRDDKSAIVIGAVTRQCAVEHDPVIAANVPLLAKAMPWIGHAATRARGTIGGSLANADPASEISLVAVTLDAILGYRDTDQAVEIRASKFFVGPMMTALPDRALLYSVLFLNWDGRIGCGFHEVNARRSDFAFAAAAAQVALDDDGVCRRLAVGVGAVADRPLRLAHAEQALTGTRLEPSSVRAAVDDALAEIETWSDLHASAEYRRRAAATLATRAILDAQAEANEKDGDAH